MSKAELLRDLYDYSEYATNRLLDVTAEVDPEAARDIIANLAHICVAQVNWLERWQTGANKVSGVVLQERMRTLADVGTALARSHADLHTYVHALTDEDLEREIACKDSSGAPLTRALWLMMTHVANHGTHHRGEIAWALTAVGHSPGDIDFGYWVDARGG